MNQILVNPLERVGGMALKEITIGDKVLKTVQTIPKLQTKSDILLFDQHRKELPPFGGAALDLWSLPSMYCGVDFDGNQGAIDDKVRPVTPLRRILDDKLLFIDPNMEAYRYRFPVKDESRLSKIMSQRGYPKAVRHIFEAKGTSGHNAAWKAVQEQKQLLALVSWQVDYYLRFTNLVIPPSPLVDGSSPNLLNIVTQVNQTAKALVFRTSDAFCAFYVAVDPSAFTEEMRCRRILNMIKENLTTNSLLVLKLFRTKRVLDDSASRNRMSRFLSELDEAKKSCNDQVAIMTLDSKSEGFALMGNGVDLTCDALGGVKDEVPFGNSKKNEDTGDQDDSQKDEYRRYGKYFHNDTREFTTITDLVLGLQPPKGLLPHNCHSCEKLHGRLLDRLQFPKSDEWNALRRLHNFTCRREEDNWLLDAISSGNDRAAALYLAQEKRGNKNLVDLLPSGVLQ